jgi:hypothetical protein
MVFPFQIVHIATCMSGYRRGLDWGLDLLTAYTLTPRDCTLQITGIEISILSLLQSPLAVSWQRILRKEA